MTKLSLLIGLLIACAIFGLGAAHAETKAETDLASITVQPLPRQIKGTANWQTVYNYSGGEIMPPGTRITAEGKWLDPVVRKDKSGVTFAFPSMPDQPTAAQPLNIGFAVEQALANFPTRATIHYTSHLDQVLYEHFGWWTPFQLTTADCNPRIFINQLRGVGNATPDSLPIHPTGENTLVFSCDSTGKTTVTSNGREATDFFIVRPDEQKPGAMLLNGLALRNKIWQLPQNTGDWFEINSFQIEQMRPSLDLSAAASVDLNVPGSSPVRVTIEVTDAANRGLSYVLRDALVPPGHYHLYWEGIDLAQSQPVNSTYASPGAYTFHLTTSKTEVHYAGEINNSAPKFNAESYSMVNCTALAMTPPGTTPVTEWHDQSNHKDTRKFDTTDSVQLLCVGYDSKWGQWVGADGTVINTKTGDSPMQHGRALTVTPPDPADPTNPEKQFYFTSKAIGGGSCVISRSFPTRKGGHPDPKTLTSPDWNRSAPTSWPYQIQIGQIPYMVGQQHFLIFEMSQVGRTQLATGEWIVRNVRLYEDGAPEPKPLAFDLAQFTPRNRTAKDTLAIPPGGVVVEESGTAVHLKNSCSVNYPYDYKITPQTILAFDLEVRDKTKLGTSNGFGLDSQPVDTYAPGKGPFFNFFAGRDQGRFGFVEPSLGAFVLPTFDPNTLYTDKIGVPPSGTIRSSDTNLLWQPSYYGLKISEDGKLLFACNNADNRLEVRDISTDGRAIAKIPLNYPMFVTIAPQGKAGAPSGTRSVFVDSPKDGVLRIPWHTADNTFGKPEIITPASEFAYPRGIVYSPVADRLFVCDTFNIDRSQVANQVVVIDPTSGKILSRFGKKGGVDPKVGGAIDEQVFTCPLTIDVDSKGALWINDYYSCEVRKYNFDAASNQFKLERRVLGSNYTNISHFYWMPGGPPTQVWTIAGFFTRNETDIGPDGIFSNQRTTSTTYQISPEALRPFAHFTKVGDHVFGTFATRDASTIYEQVDDGWAMAACIGNNAGDAAREAGLLAAPGESPTDLDKAITASGDADWEKEPFAWTDLNGDGKVEYTAENPEFQIGFKSNIIFDGNIPPSSCLRADGAFVRSAKGGIAVIPATMVNGKPVYSWKDSKVIPRTQSNDPKMAARDVVSDVVAQDNRYYGLRISTQRHDVGADVACKVECYDDDGKLLWTRSQNDFSIVNLQSVGDGLISVMDRSWFTDGPIYLRTSDGDLVTQVFCREGADCWANSALRVDADTAYLGLVQAYKVTGLSTIKSSTATITLSSPKPQTP